MPVWRQFRAWLAGLSARWLRPGQTPGELGRSGEDLAAELLRGQGFRILHRQCRTPWGEVDLIAEDGEWIVFVEVKTRRTAAAGHPTEAVTPAKQEQLTRLAMAWLKQHRLLHRRARFDVVAVLWPDPSQPPQLTHYRHAFEPRGPVG